MLAPHVLSRFGFLRIVMMGVSSSKHRHRKSVEKLRLPLVTRLLLSNDGDPTIEGSVLNFFVQVAG